LTLNSQGHVIAKPYEIHYKMTYVTKKQFCTSDININVGDQKAYKSNKIVAERHVTTLVVYSVNKGLSSALRHM